MFEQNFMKTVGKDIDSAPGEELNSSSDEGRKMRFSSDIASDEWIWDEENYNETETETEEASSHGTRRYSTLNN